uniref:Uncharacterized protein n=1 Tax=Anguilla anguilla TaxID=7936 RepID=A0A0E9SBI3_ANGAN
MYFCRKMSTRGYFIRSLWTRKRLIGMDSDGVIVTA